MLTFDVSIKSGSPIYEQVVWAVKSAIARGKIKPGDPMPSVRELSRELQINPNTAQKVLTALVNERLVEVSPGIGSVVSNRRASSPEKVEPILGEQLEILIIEAITFGVDEASFLRAVQEHWKKIRSGESK